jgi:hypothetical protein
MASDSDFSQRKLKFAPRGEVKNGPAGIQISPIFRIDDTFFDKGNSSRRKQMFAPPEHKQKSTSPIASFFSLFFFLSFSF